MTEVEWLASNDPAAMGAAVSARTRGSPRVLRLYIAAFWHWQSYRLRGATEKLRLRARAAIVGEWAESGARPDGADTVSNFVGFNANARQAFRATVRAPGNWHTNNAPAVKFAVRLLREVFGNPFAMRRKRKSDPLRGNMFDPAWRTDTAVALARTMYDDNDFSAMPILADALQDAGCANDDLLAHCREPGEHVRGCWVVDAVLGRE
jgi:hypothetical protein